MDTENSCFEKEDRETKEEDIVLFELEEKVGKSSAQFIFPPPRDSPSEWEGLRFATESPTLFFYTFITSGGIKLPALTWANWST